MASSETSTRLRARRNRPKSTTLNNTTADTYQTVARVIAKANGLVIERRERIGDIQPHRMEKVIQPRLDSRAMAPITEMQGI